MDDDPQLWKIKYEDLNNFEFFEKCAFTIPFVKDSVEYLLTIRYKFENYVTNKIHTAKKKLVSNKTTNLSKTNNQLIPINSYREIVNLEQIRMLDILDKREAMFYDKLNNLIRLQMNRMRLHQELPGINIKNQINYNGEEQVILNVKEIRENLIWLGSKEQLQLLIEELITNKFLAAADKERVLRLFCDNSGKTFNRIKKEMVRWQRKNTELSMMIKEFSEGSNKLLSNERIWARTAKCFLDQNGKQLKPNNLGVAYQKGKRNELLGSIVKKIKLLQPTE